MQTGKSRASEPPRPALTDPTLPQETIPADFHTQLDVYAQQGYRIIAVAYKSLSRKINYAKIQRISREKVECDLSFVGFVILENRLKPDTLEIINSLMAANIRTVMVTGDNILTALSVAHDCDMIPTGQNIIIVTAKPQPLHPSEYELIYNLSGMQGNNNQIPESATVSTAIGGVPNSVSNHVVHRPAANGFVVNERAAPNGTGATEMNYTMLTGSNSIASLETVDTCTQTTQITQRDIESGNNKFDGGSYHYGHDEADAYDDDNSMKLVPELPNNNYRFAMTGKTWSIIRDEFPDLLPKFVTRGTVFARMSPDQKQSLILELQTLGYYVAMCGDGANDCGALKAAHTGISLSEAESSVASPFTSKNATIACVPNIIKEGRCALVTSVAIFKYMAAYSLVQLASVLILYSIDSNLTDIEFLYIDLFMISIFAFFFGKTESYVGPLVKRTPLNSLISVSPIASLVIHLLLAFAFQIIAWFYLQQQSWFVPYQYSIDDDEIRGCYENYTVFIISCFQYIILAVVFSKGAPYRKSIFTNIGFISSLVVNTVVTVLLAVVPATLTSKLFDIVYPPDPMFRYTLIGLGLCNFLLSLVIEVYFVENFLFRKLRYRFHNVEKSRRKFLAIENHLRQKVAWPPISQFGNDMGSGGGCASTPTSAAVTSPTLNSEADHQSPKSFTEICVEADSLTPFDNSNSVLKGFFDNIGSDDESDGMTSDSGDDDAIESQTNGDVPQKSVNNSILPLTQENGREHGSANDNNVNVNHRRPIDSHLSGGDDASAENNNVNRKIENSIQDKQFEYNLNGVYSPTNS